MSRQIKGNHTALLPHPLIIEHAMVLTAIASSSMQEDNILVAFTRLLVEDLTLAPHRRSDIHVTTNNMIFILLRLFVRRRRTDQSVMQQLEATAPNMRPMRKGILVALDFDACVLISIFPYHKPSCSDAGYLLA